MLDQFVPDSLLIVKQNIALSTFIFIFIEINYIDLEIRLEYIYFE